MLPIPIQPRDHISDVLERIASSTESSVTVMIPPEADLAQSLVTLRIIERQAAASGKTIRWKSTSPEFQGVLDRAFLKEVPEAPVQSKVAAEDAPTSAPIAPPIPPAAEMPTPPINPTLPSMPTTPIASAPVSEPTPVTNQSNDTTPLVREAGWSVRRARRRALFFAAGAIVLGIIAFAAIAPRATLIATPQSEPLVADLEVVLSPTPTDQQVAVRWVDVSISVSESIDASGTKTVTTPAEGPVEFSNAYSSTAITVPAGAQLTDDRGVAYRLKDAVTVPGGVFHGANKEPGTASGHLIAVEGGEKGNRGGGTFSMAYTGYDPASSSDFTATTTGLSGGTEEDRAVIAEADIAALKDRVEGSMAMAIASQVEPERHSDETFFPGGWIVVKPHSTDDHVVGDEADTVTRTLTATVRVGLFNQADVRSALLALADLRKGADRQFLTPPEVAMTLALVDADKQQMFMRWHVDTSVSVPLDQDLIIEKSRGLTPDAVKALAKEDDLHLKALSAKLWPWWVDAVPRAKSRITVEIRAGS